MDRFEQIEMLRQRADVSYEEARDVLEAAGGDLLEAIVLLEKQGKIRKNAEAGTDPQAAGAEQPGCRAPGNGGSAGKAEKKRHEKSAFGRAVSSVGNFLAHTSFHIKHKGTELFMMPSWTFAVLMLFFWHTLVPVMVIALFFGVRYSFDGSEDTEAANDILEKAGSFADGVESSFAKKEEERAAQTATAQTEAAQTAAAQTAETASAQTAEAAAAQNADA